LARSRHGRGACAKLGNLPEFSLQCFLLYLACDPPVVTTKGPRIAAFEDFRKVLRKPAGIRA
jgi:hypothetical protein